jgi:hypothetical protein
MCGCGGGGAARSVKAPQIANTNLVAKRAAMHPAAQAIENIQKLADERRKVERLRREQLIKAMLKP